MSIDQISIFRNVQHYVDWIARGNGKVNEELKNSDMKCHKGGKEKDEDSRVTKRPTSRLVSLTDTGS